MKLIDKAVKKYAVAKRGTTHHSDMKFYAGVDKKGNIVLGTLGDAKEFDSCVMARTMQGRLNERESFEWLADELLPWQVIGIREKVFSDV